MSKLSIFVCLLLFGSQSHAQGSSESRARLLRPSQSFNDPAGWWGFVGVNMGLVDSNTSLQHEKDVSGSQLDIRLLGSYYFENSMWLGDLGLGLQNSSFDKGQTDQSVSAVYVEASPRYRLNNNWQFGPALKTFILGESDFFADSESPATFLGAAINYELA